MYPLYIDVLVQSDDEIKSIILSEDPIKDGEEIFYNIGNGSFSYKLRSDINNFDEYLMASSLIDLIVVQGYDSLIKEHMQIFMLACGKNPDKTINVSQNSEQWFRFFQKVKDFLLVSICDEELVEDALVILHNFLTSPTMKF